MNADRTAMPSRRRLLAALAMAPLTSRTWADTWPSRPLTLVVPWPAGNPTDAISRRLQPMLSKSLGQPVVVENIAGAGGTLGAGKVIGQAADGHALLMGTPSELILSPLQIPSTRYAPSDFRMVGLLGRVPYVLLSRTGLPQATLEDVVALREKSNAAALSVGNVGPGSLIHIVGEQFAKVVGLNATHVPYKGVPPMVQDLLANQLDLAFVPVNGSTMAMVEQGKLRALGITAASPYPLYPDLKPMVAGAQGLEGLEFDVWGGMFVPKGVAPETQARLSQVFYDATRDAGFREWMRSTGSDVTPPMSLAQLDAFYQAEIVRYQRLARLIPVTQ